MTEPMIVIDPGHGSDHQEGRSTAPGVRGPAGTQEKDVTLRLAQRIADILGPLVTLTRKDDTNLSLAARAEIARRAGANVFISLHANAGRVGERGAETWVHDHADEGSRRLAGRVLAALAALPDSPPQRGVKTGPMAVLTPELLGSSTAACLLEVDFLSDPDGERRLTDDNALSGIASAIAAALRDHASTSTAPALPSYGQPPASVTLGQRGNSGGARAVSRYGAGARKRALLVGINDYTLATPSGDDNLRGCVPDADAMERVLTGSLGFAASDIVRLSDRAATREAISSSLSSLMAASQAGDVLCFYYSGHGTYIPDAVNGSATRFAQALFCADGQPLRDRELAALVDSSLADGVNFTVILDSCFSGGMGELAGVPDTLRGRPLPAAMTSDGASVTLVPVGLCMQPGKDPAVSGTISNATFVCSERPNTTAVPYSRATLFTAVDFCELAGERNGRGDYTSALERVLLGANTPLTCAQVQRAVVERVEVMRASGLADDYENPMLRAQGSRLDEGFLEPFTASEVGLSLAHAAPRPRQAPIGPHSPTLAGITRVAPVSAMTEANGYSATHGIHELYET